MASMDGYIFDINSYGGYDVFMARHHDYRGPRIGAVYRVGCKWRAVSLTKGVPDAVGFGTRRYAAHHLQLEAKRRWRR